MVTWTSYRQLALSANQSCVTLAPAGACAHKSLTGSKAGIDPAVQVVCRGRGQGPVGDADVVGDPVDLKRLSVTAF